MESLDEVTELRMSGARAVFQVKRGETLEPKEIREAFADKGMKLEKFEPIELAPAKSVYHVNAAVT